MSSFDTSKVKSGRSMFFRCYAVKNIELNSSRFDTGNMTSMYGMFGACYSLTSVDVSGFKTGKVKDMSYMFNGDSELKDLDISSFDMKKVEKKKKMIAGTKLEEKQKEEEKKKKEEGEKKKKEEAKKKSSSKYEGEYSNDVDEMSIKHRGDEYFADIYIYRVGYLELDGYIDDGILWVDGADPNGNYLSGIITKNGSRATFTIWDTDYGDFYEGEEFVFYAN